MPNPQLRDLVTILYRPRETMRRILDARDRWTIQVVVLAYFCSAINDSDLRQIENVLPGLTPLNAGIIGILSLIAIAACWVLIFYLVSWLVVFAGRLLGGTGTAPDVRAALAWGLVPVVWSAIPRIPIAVYQYHLDIGPRVAGREGVMQFIEQGGCAFAVVVFIVQMLVFGAWLAITSFTVAEAQGFSGGKGFANVAVTVAGPLAIVAAAVIASNIT